MRLIIPAFCLLSPAISAAEALAVPQVPERAASAISLLPNGSVLQSVMLPQYDENRHLSAALRAEKMILVAQDIISAETITIDLFNPDRIASGRIEMASGVLNQAKGLLNAQERVVFQRDRTQGVGSGLIYDFNKREGFLIGPAVTWIQPATETSMNSSHSPRHSAASLLVGVALITAPAAAQPSVEEDAVKASGEAREKLREELDASAAATNSAAEFLEKAEIVSPATGATPAPATPLQIEPGPDSTVISCDGGMYFDADKGVFIYLKNVRVEDPRFTMTGGSELKVFLEPKKTQQPQKPTGDEKPAAGIGAGFGDVERIVATGAVKVLQKQAQPGKEPVEASGAILTYYPKSGDIVITGGYPWVKQGTSFMRAKEPDLSLRIRKNGSYVTQGNWDMGGKLNQNR